LTGDDIAEVIVFAAGRPENVVLADTLIFPSHQVGENGALGRESGVEQDGRLTNGIFLYAY
jgi:3-hydroxy acid dehydrogenase / malonic semialdehyde reductase